MLHCIGSGSYGEVWLARNATGQYRAAKVLYHARFESERPYEREFAGITHFEPISRTHDGFVDILQVGRNDPARCFYYVMELADDLLTGLNPNTPAPSGAPSPAFDPIKYEARTLSATLARQGRLAVAECIRLGLALTAALEHLHRHSLVHRDIKPSNIIYVNGQPKLADVGTVADTSEARSIVGTRGFMPNEGAGSVQGDLYALGNVLYVASTAHGADDWPNPLTALGELPEQKEWLELNEVVNKACDPDCKRRYAFAAEMQAELALLQGGKSLRHLRIQEKRLKQAVWVLAGITLIALVGLATLFIQRKLVKAAQRSVLLLQLEKQIRPPHTDGWSERAWLMASNASLKFGFDTDLQSQAAASLAGLDAKLCFQTNGIGGSSVAFDPDGKRVLFGSLPDQAGHPGKAHLLDLATTNLAAFPVPGAGPVGFLPDGTPVQFSTNDSTRLALWVVGQASQPAALRYFDLAAGEQLTNVSTFAMTPNGASVAASGRTAGDHALCAVWDGTSGHLLRQLEASGDVIALTPDGSFLALGDAQGEVAVWRISDGRPLPKIPASRNPILSMAFCRDLVCDPLNQPRESQCLLAVGDSAADVTIWEVPAQKLKTRCMGGQFERTAMAFSPDGTLLASGGRLPTLVWDAATGREVTTIRGDFLTGLAISDDGGKLAATSRGQSPRAGIFALEDGRGIHTLRGLSTTVQRVCCSSDARLLAAVAEDWKVGIWDLTRDRLLHVFRMPRGLFAADNVGLAFSPDDSRLAFMSGTHALLLAVNSGELIQSWPIPPGRVDELAFDPAGRLYAFHFESADVAAAPLSVPRTARIRELLPEGGIAELLELPEFNFDVRGASWAPDASFIVIVGTNVKAGLTNRFLSAVSLTGKTNLWAWPQNLRPYEGAFFALDAAGGLVAFTLGPSRDARMDHDLRQTRSGRRVRSVAFLTHALNSSAKLLVGPPTPDAWSVHSLADDSLLVLVQPADTKPAFTPTFSRDGRFLAWGNEDGTVSACDLHELKQRLGELELDWPKPNSSSNSHPPGDHPITDQESPTGPVEPH
jgi:WD40 repeat protein